MTGDQGALVRLDDVTIGFNTRQGKVMAVKNASWQIERGEILGIVGESGSGKSVSTLALIGLLDANGFVESGTIEYKNQRLALDDPGRDKKLRSSMAMIFQYPRTALNPIRRVGQQIIDVLLAIGVKGRQRDLKARALQLLEEVQIHDPEQRFYAYPFELSGGMCQRILIAMALAREPDLLIADEPTTGLDVVTQQTILELITTAASRRKMATLFITHDLGLAAKYCDRIVVMQTGCIVEQAPARELFSNPRHPYTRALIAATPALMSSLDELRGVIMESVVMDSARESAA